MTKLQGLRGRDGPFTAPFTRERTAYKHINAALSSPNTVQKRAWKRLGRLKNFSKFLLRGARGCGIVATFPNKKRA
ncbi:MAG: hypothetical protein FWF96_02240 [Kiritimatiellaeota bacterium]|nr:hypothetical protein [Kiritimatiellota bacterium]